MPFNVIMGAIICHLPYSTNSAWVSDAFVCVMSVCMDAEHLMRIWAFDSFFFSFSAHFIQSFKLVSYLIFRSRYSCLNSLLHTYTHTCIYTLTTVSVYGILLIFCSLNLFTRSFDLSAFAFTFFFLLSFAFHFSSNEIWIFLWHYARSQQTNL